MTPHLSCDTFAPSRAALHAPDPREGLVIRRQSLTPATRGFRVHAPVIARTARPGQFLIVRSHERAERIPLTIADFDPAAGWVEMVVQVVGHGTRRMDEAEEGDRFLDVAGPLGHPSEIANFGSVVTVSGGVGVAPVFPIQRALKAAGNRVTSIVGARSKDLLFWEDRMRETSDRLLLATDDGSAGEKGFVTTVLKRLIEAGEPIDRVVAIGPPVMMRAVAEVTRPRALKTIVSLNTIMVDGTGMCGGCRVEVGGKTRFTCVDGPEFDGHEVDFDLLISRLGTYQEAERRLAAAAEEAPPRKSAVRVAMPEQPADARRRNFDEVALGYTEEQARAEAMRCLQCRKPLCIEGCPVGIDIPAFIRLVAEGRPLAAARKIKEQNNLPAVCGRVCPQETQCEERCVIGRKGQPVAIGRLERFAADREAALETPRAPVRPAPTGKRVAVIGAGPAGLSAAADLALLGHGVTVFEALHAPGGVLLYGIPEFRLPKAIVRRECGHLERLGVDFRANTPVGPGLTGAGLLEQGFDAVFIGTGAGLPMFLGVPGENLKGVYSSNEYLTRVNLMGAYRFPEYGTPVLPGRRVAVVGGGNVAMDAARCAVRLGAESVTLVYRRTRAEMPARAEEVHHALEEGVELRELTAPARILGDGQGWVEGLRCVRMELGEPDASGRRRPVEVSGSEHVIPADQVVVAIGNRPNPMLTRSWPGLSLDRRGNIPVDGDRMTNVPGVFAGGDIVTGAATVIEAMGAGRRAARAIHAWLTRKGC
jgi:glutamate synthase (NADPH/NADH) small chain